MEQLRISEQLEWDRGSTGTIPRVLYENSGSMMDKTEFGTGFVHGCVEYPQLERTPKQHQSCAPKGRISSFKKIIKLITWLFLAELNPFLKHLGTEEPKLANADLNSGETEGKELEEALGKVVQRLIKKAAEFCLW